MFIEAGLFILSKHNIFITVNKNESLVNTNSSLDSIELHATNINKDPIVLLDEPTNNLQYVEASIQTANINVETGV